MTSLDWNSETSLSLKRSYFRSSLLSYGECVTLETCAELLQLALCYSSLDWSTRTLTGGSARQIAPASSLVAPGPFRSFVNSISNCCSVHLSILFLAFNH